MSQLLDFNGTKLSFRRSLISYSKVQLLIAMFIRNRTWYINRSRISKKDYLDVGCGPNSHEDFINLDYGWNPSIDLCWDICRGIPLDDDSVKGIFTEHCLEHVPLHVVDATLGEFFRVLKPKGTVRIIVPDGELYLTRYADIVRTKLDTSLPYSANDFYQGIYTPIMSVNRIFLANGHQFIYDFNTLSKLLLKNGFTEIKQQSYRSGRDSQLLIDTKSRAVESLYVEATKPTR